MNSSTKNDLTSVDAPGSEFYSLARTFGDCLSNELKTHGDFFFFSPDETTSNRLDAVFESSERAWLRETRGWDLHLAPNGHIVELLSENTLFAVLAGHVLSGGRGALASYEAFFPIVASQIDQHLKFLRQSKTIAWRPDYHALNLLSTSCWQRQDHNGFTHQNPSLISHLLAKPSNLVNCLFPCDDISAFTAWDFMSQSQNVLNFATFNKIRQPRWIDINHARFQLTNGGASIFQFCSDPDPDIIVTGIGDIPTAEAIKAVRLVKEDAPELRIRYVGITALSYGAIGLTGNKMRRPLFDSYFTTDKPVIINFHGYPETIRAIFSHYTATDRLDIHGYEDRGSTTSPLDELARNHCSRYDLAISILEHANRADLIPKYRVLLEENLNYAKLYGVDR